jgi:hypothetical protein
MKKFTRLLILILIIAGSVGSVPKMWIVSDTTTNHSPRRLPWIFDSLVAGDSVHFVYVPGQTNYDSIELTDGNGTVQCH